MFLLTYFFFFFFTEDTQFPQFSVRVFFVTTGLSLGVWLFYCTFHVQAYRSEICWGASRQSNELCPGLKIVIEKEL